MATGRPHPAADKAMISRWLPLLLMLVGVDVCAEPADDAARITKLYAEYREAVEAGSIDGYLSVLHPEVRLLPPGAAPIVGAAHYASFLTPVFDRARYRIEVVSYPAIDVVGDIATAEYEYIVYLSLKDDQVGVSQAGALSAQRTRSRYFDVLRRQPGGAWAIWRHTWTVLEEG